MVRLVPALKRRGSSRRQDRLLQFNTYVCSIGRKEVIPLASGTKQGSDFRRADNGRYTTEKYADKHPKTTIKETRKK
jgi:hypothetical protein